MLTNSLNLRTTVTTTNQPSHPRAAATTLTWPRTHRPHSHSLSPRCDPCPEAAVMVRLVNVRMRSTFLLVQFLSTCSGIAFKEPEECHSKNGELNVTLEFGHVTIPKDRTGLPGNLQMLGFNVPGKPGRSPGPTLRVRAGDTLRILLKNTMTPELVSTRSVRNGYHGFDTVNLHTHGLHISPLAPGDEVVNTKVLPGETYEYTYHIPKDHMGGTHWYHPHGHGAVSIHVNFGAAGMIIVEDAVHQLPGELLDVVHEGPVEDYIVAAYHVDFDDITTIANGPPLICLIPTLPAFVQT